MIPLRDVIPSRTTPYITVAIIFLNAAAWCYELVLPSDVLPAFLQSSRASQMVRQTGWQRVAAAHSLLCVGLLFLSTATPAWPLKVRSGDHHGA